MNALVVTWSMCASLCLMLGLVHLFFWYKSRQVTAYLLSALMAFSAAVNTMLELALMLTESLDVYGELIRWANLSIFMILVPMVWFVYQYFNTGRRWLAIAITILWVAGIVINFLSPGSLTFDLLTDLKREHTFLGESFSLPEGDLNQWRLLADAASLLILIYIIDATYKLWKRRDGDQTWITGSAIVAFILFAGIHTPLVDAGVVSTPYMIGFSFIAIVLALSYQVVRDAIRAMRYKLDLQQARHSLDQYGKADLLGECGVMLAHELNQPLTAILSNAQAAQRYIDSDHLDVEEVRAILRDIVDDDRRASEIIKRIRMLLKNEEGTREYFDLNAIIEEVVEMLRSELEDNNIGLSTNFAGELVPVYAGRIEVQLVLMNLLLNALKAMADSSRQSRSLSIITQMRGDEALVEIGDTGPGIAEDLHDSLFNRFISGEGDRLGMGLAISRRIIERFGGRIWAENKEDGGAVFSFTLPLKDTRDVNNG